MLTNYLWKPTKKPFKGSPCRNRNFWPYSAFFIYTGGTGVDGMNTKNINIKRISDLEIQALVDGEVDDRTALALLDALQRDPTLHNRYLLYKKQKSLLKSWWKDN